MFCGGVKHKKKEFRFLNVDKCSIVHGSLLVIEKFFGLVSQYIMVGSKNISFGTVSKKLQKIDSCTTIRKMK
jgi:hypothetical protein